MTEIIGVRFQNVGKIYYFDPDGAKLNLGDRVIVETARGVECDHSFPIPDEYLREHIEHIASHVAGTVARSRREK